MRFSHVGRSPLRTAASRLAAWPGLPRSRCASPYRGMRKHSRGHSDPATHGRGLSPATAGALAGSGTGGQLPPLGGRAPASSPRVARASPPGIPLASLDLWPCAPRFRALRTGGVVCAISDLRAVGSALLRSQLRAVGSFGRAGHTAHSTVVHGCAIVHAAEAMPPRRPDHHKLAHEWSAHVCQSAQPPADRSVQRLKQGRHWTAPTNGWAARRRSGPPLAR
jgi:hypothetical protein